MQFAKPYLTKDRLMTFASDNLYRLARIPPLTEVLTQLSRFQLPLTHHTDYDHTNANKQYQGQPAKRKNIQVSHSPLHKSPDIQLYTLTTP